ncbi:MAG: hypothetical protein V4577_12475 [Bacteroidota bacterium]
MKKKLTPMGECSLKIDWSKNQLSKSEMKKILGGGDPPPCPKPGSVYDDPFCRPSN